MTSEADKKLADEVVEKLFTNGAGTKATRLVLVKDNGPPTNIIAAHQNLGGYSRFAIRDIIRDALSAQREADAKIADAEAWAAYDDARAPDLTKIAAAIRQG